MATCPKHGCVITETITDDVFCGVCRDAEKSQQISKLEDELAHYKKYAGSQMLMSDFQTADQMRAALQAERFLVQQLKMVVVSTMTNHGWSREDAHHYIEQEFSIDKAHQLMGQYTNEN